MDPRVRMIKVQHIEVVLEDLSGLGPGDEFESCLEQATALIHAQPEGSVRTMLDVTDTHFDPAVADRIKNFATNNNPFVHATAVVGLTPLMKIIFNSVTKLTDRAMIAFPDRESALDWVVNA